MISLNLDTGYQHLDELVWSDADERTGVSVKLKELPFLVRLFKIVAPNGGIEWLITNDLQVTTSRFVAENSNAVRWQLEEFHRSFNRPAEAATHRFGAVPMSEGSCPAKPLSLLLPCLGFAYT